MRSLLASPRRRAIAGLVAAAIVWVATLVIVAAVGEAVVVQRADRGTAPPEEVAAPTPSTAPLPSSSERPLPSLFPALPVALGIAPPATTTPTTEPDLGISDPLESTPPPPSFLPELPVIELPPLPAALQPLLRLTGPTVRVACSTTGVVIVLSALVKGDLEAAGIPVSQALTYLAPILSVCALFPADEPSICSVDKALNDALIPKDLQILVGVPSLAALALDQVDSVVGLLRSTGLPLPDDITQSVATALGCELR